MFDRGIEIRSDVLLEEIDWVVVSGDFVNRFSNSVARLQVDRVLGFLPAVDNVSKVDDYGTFLTSQFSRRFFPLFFCSRILLVSNMRVANDDEVQRDSAFRFALQTSGE